jgi:DNA-binding winged helix-turn-helix (wHTH) protein/Tol biopolymer transport system component
MPKGGCSTALNVSFGPFELDLLAGELRKDGRRIRLQEQPFQILRLLLESPGEVVPREEIRSRLWPNDTVVEFDHSINAAVKRLRDSLRDSADQPRYIETMARRGYRFIGQVNVSNQPAAAAPVAITSGEDLLSPPPESSLSRWQSQRPRIVIAASMMLLAFAGALYYWRATRRMEPTLQPLVRLEVDLGNEVSPSSERGANAILSPDGTRLVYVSQSRLFTQLLDQTKATEMAGTGGAYAPFFSPDGQWVAFFASEKLKKVSVQGGPATVLCNAPLPNGGSWGEDGAIIAALDNFGLSRIPSGGVAATPVTELAAGEIIHRWPQILPGGRAVLFSAYSSMTGVEGANIEVMSLGDRRRKTIQRGGAWGRYLPTGHLVYIDKGALFAVPFDPDRLEVRGTPMRVLEGVAYSTASGSAELDFSRTGRLVYRSSRSGGGLVTVQWLDGSGKTWPLLAVPGNYLSPTVSPDGNRLAMTSAGDIWVYELRGGKMRQLTFGSGYGSPLWSGDRFIVFRAARGMFWTRADGAGSPQPLTQSENRQNPWSFTDDGKRLAFVEVNAVSGADIWTVPVESDGSGLRAGKPEAFLQTSFDERTPMFSPDGRWLAYSSNESGDSRVYVQAFPDKRGEQQVSDDGGKGPAWSRNRRELYFWQFGTNQLMVASYKVRGDSFLPEKPRVWSEKRLASFISTRSYDLALDGKRIVALMPADGPEAQKSQGQLIFLQNFFDEVRRRAPSGGNRVYR